MTIDAIMLSYCKSEKELQMTRNAIKSLRKLNNEVDFNLVVVETGDKVDLDAKVIYPGIPFNYNQYLTIGYQNLTNKSEYLLILNNDIICLSGFAGKLINALEIVDSVSPLDPTYPIHKTYKSELTYEMRPAYTLCGWCIMVKKKIFNIMPFENFFPIDFPFWYQDNYYGDQLKKNGLKHALVRDAHVIHLESKSHYLLEDKGYLTTGQKEIYERKVRSSV